MKVQENKCVIIIDEDLPAGIIANTAAILGATLGKAKADMVGRDTADASGRLHPGIIEIPIPILKSSRQQLQELREKLYEPEYEQIFSADFSDLAQTCRTYDEFTDRMSRTAADRLHYLGLILCGPKKKVSRLTGNLPLLR